MATRKTTTKLIGGRKVQTNPLATADYKIAVPKELWEPLYEAVYAIFRAGIAIGRARATASPGKAKRK